MSYSTGSGATITDLMDALRVFAIAEGWTVDKWDAVNRLLFLTKGLVTVTMRGDISQNVTVWTGPNGSGSSSSASDHRLYFAMGTSNNPALATYHSHPGSPVTSNTDLDAPWVGGLKGPFIAWHFFSDATVSDHIHCVVQIGAELYKHFSFGQVDKRGLSHSGVAYLTATPTTHYRNVNSYIGESSTNGAMNSPSFQPYPFISSPNFGPGSTGPIYSFSAPLILKNSNAWPAHWQTPIASASGSGTLRGLALRLRSYSIQEPSFWGVINTSGGLLDCLVNQPATPFSNVVPLFPLPVLRHHNDTSNAALQRMCYVGDYPNVRAVNMENLIPGQDVSMGSDTFTVFPVVRQADWADTFITPLPSSGQFGLAYKKVP